MSKVTQLKGRAVPVVGDDIDTDRIIPARFLKSISFEGLEDHLFEDDRQQLATHPVSNPAYRSASVMLVNANFGCGSSREHAPQAIHKAGFRAVVAENFAEIFFGNSTTLGIPCVNAAREDIAKVAAAIEKDPNIEVIVDVAALEVRFGNDKIKVTQRESARDALVNGRWDAIGDLIDGIPAVQATAAKLPYMAAA